MGRIWLVLLLAAALAGCGGESAEQYLQQGVKHFDQRNYDAAIASYQKALKLEPRSAAAYNLLGMAYRFKGNQSGQPGLREKEIAAFQQAVELDPRFWVAMINLGATYYAMGDKAKAAPWFKKALAINPGHPEKAQLEKIIAESESRP
jgi:tetratricopeptide (TPR) repeat protein